MCNVNSIYGATTVSIRGRVEPVRSLVRRRGSASKVVHEISNVIHIYNATVIDIAGDIGITSTCAVEFRAGLAHIPGTTTIIAIFLGRGEYALESNTAGAHVFATAYSKSANIDTAFTCAHTA